MSYYFEVDLGNDFAVTQINEQTFSSSTIQEASNKRMMKIDVPKIVPQNASRDLVVEFNKILHPGVAIRVIDDNDNRRTREVYKIIVNFENKKVAFFVRDKIFLSNKADGLDISSEFLKEHSGNWVEEKIVLPGQLQYLELIDFSIQNLMVCLAKSFKEISEREFAMMDS